MESSITPNASDQQLVANDNESATSLLHDKQGRRRENLSEVTFFEYMTVGILCYVNLINYMDRFTLAGVLDDVKTAFSIEDDKAGLIQTVFVVAYMVFAPIFGYLGDRYSRRYIMSFGVALWSLTTLVGSFMPEFKSFLLFRGLVGIGEASYSTIAPTIISDLFVGSVRSKMLAFFYFAIPVGSGLGYIVGSGASSIADNWRWGLRVTPILGAVAVMLMLWVMEDPERGAAEESHMKATTYKEDLRYLVKNPSFMLSTLAFTCVAFVTGALAWWGPQFIFLGLSRQPGVDIDIGKVSYKFGLVGMAAGAMGVPLGSLIAQRLRPRLPDADPLVCALALIASAPLIYMALLATSPAVPQPLVYLMVFLGMLTLNLTWSIVADIVLYVVVPPKRSTAEAFQILISHMLGDAGSPYLVGVISESLKRKFSPFEAPSKLVEFRSLQYALFVTCFVEILGGLFFFLTAIYIVKDKVKVERAIAEAQAQNAEPSHSTADSSTTE